jgi:PHAX RNA-binding domain
METQPLSPEEIEGVARELAEQLGETQEQPVQQIRQIVELAGADFARDLYKATLETEEQGGLMLPDNSRRRTLGGVYFYLARMRLSDEHHKIIFPGYNRRKTDAPPPPRLPAFIWDERVSLIETLMNESGGISSMKVTLVGRPGKIEARHEVIVTTMSDVIKVPTLPKGVPPPPTTPTLYTVYIASKQWRKVEESLANPDDNLIVEGVCVYDPEIKGMAVFANNVQSKMMEIKRREEQKATTAGDAAVASPPKSKPAPQPAPEKPPRSTRSRIADSIPATPVTTPAPSTPAGMPPEAAQKLSGLYASASLFRQKIANLKSKPEGQQGGLEMTQKLLKNVEDEIAALEKKYADK